MPSQPKPKVKVKPKRKSDPDAWRKQTEREIAAEEKAIADLPEVDRPFALPSANKFGVRKFLDHFGLARLRFNELRYEVEVEPERDLENWKLKRGVWQPLDKEDGDIIHAMYVTAKAIGRVPSRKTKEAQTLEAMPHFKMGKEDFYGSVSALAMDAGRFNAWTEHTKDLSPTKCNGKWDDSFLKTAFTHCFGIPKTPQNPNGEFNDYYMDALRLCFTTMLLRQRSIADLEDEEGVHVRTSLHLRGPPGCGKSSFFSESFPKGIGRSLFLEKLNIEEKWPEPEGRRTLGAVMCHTPEYHKYQYNQVMNWVSSHDLPADTMKVLFRQRSKYVVRGWTHTFSSNSEKRMPDVEAMNDRLATLDVDWKMDGDQQLNKRATEFFKDEDNGKRLLCAAMASLENKFDPGNWASLGYSKLQDAMIKETAHIPHRGIYEHFQEVLSKKCAYKLDYLRTLAKTVEEHHKEFMVTAAAERLGFENKHRKDGNWWMHKSTDPKKIKPGNFKTGHARTSEMDAALNKGR